MAIIRRSSMETMSTKCQYQPPHI